MTTPPETPPLGFRLGRLGRLARKELTEILRDRRTIFTLVLMPLLLYPLLVLAFRVFVLSAEIDRSPPPVVIALPPGDAARVVAHYLGEGLPERRIEYKPERDDLEDDVRAGRVDLALRPRPGAPLAFQPRREFAFDCDLIYRDDSAYARDAVGYLRRVCAAANGHVMQELLQARGLRQRPDPLRLADAPLSADRAAGLSLAVFVPLVLILMTITGAVYPAIDLTAGERERGTLEILVAAPIPRMSVLFGKYVAVLTVAVLTALVNLTAMTISILLSGQTEKVFGAGGLSVLTLLEVFALVLLFAAFFSAVLLVLTSFARSFKEAQAYLIPLMLLSLAPGVAGLMPGLVLAGPLAVVPLLNIVLLARDLLLGVAHPVSACVVVASTAAYAAAALYLAARLFGAEAVLYTEAASWGGLFRRRDRS